MAQQTELDSEVRSIVDEHLRPNECVQGWSRDEDKLIVRLIDKDLHRTCQKNAKRFGRGAGKGRSLQFKIADGK